MNVETITMPRADAEAKLRHYRAHLHKTADAEYRAVAEGYKALANGTPLLNLNEIFRTCPLDEKHRPKLAIARADRLHVAVSRQSRTRFTFDARKSGYQGKNLELTFEGPEVRADFQYWECRGRSVVPLIPADVLATVERDRKLDRTKHFVFFEVEKWDDVPHDPFLIRHLAGELYVVIAEWNLTDLERMVIAGRRN